MNDKITIKNQQFLSNIKMKKPTILLIVCFLIYSCKNEENAIGDNTFIVKGTKSDKIEPWLALRDSTSMCSNLIGKLPDDTKVNLIRGSETDDYVQVELKIKGFVNKKYLENYNEILKEPKDLLERKTKEILNIIKSGNISKIKRFIRQDSLKLYYWDLPKCSLDDNFFNNLSYNYIDGNTEENIIVSGKNILRILKRSRGLNPKYMGKDFFPGGGFGGGSVMPPSGETHIVVVALSSREFSMSDKLWFEFSEKNKDFSLTQIGNWEWTP